MKRLSHIGYLHLMATVFNSPIQTLKVVTDIERGHFRPLKMIELGRTNLLQLLAIHTHFARGSSLTQHNSKTIPNTVT